MKKLTAFEWYIEQHNIIVRSSDNISIEERFKRFSDIIERTKQMEKEQIINAANDGYDEAINEHQEFTSADDYYNKIYGDKKVK
jgi:hypothetical protein